MIRGIRPASVFFIYLSFSKASTFRLPAKFFGIPEGLRSTYSVTWFYEVSRSEFAKYYLALTDEVPNESEAPPLKGTLCYPLARRLCRRASDLV